MIVALPQRLVNVATLALTFAAAGCASRPVCEPASIPVAVPAPPVLVVRPVPPRLLREHPVATGPLRHCPDVRDHNAGELRACNADKALIRARGHAAGGEE